MASNPTVGQVIRAAREAVRLNVKDLASLSGVARRTFTRWENGDTVPPGDARAKIVAAVRRYDDAIGRHLAAQLGVELPAVRLPEPAKAPPTHDALATFEAEVFFAADALDLPPRRVRAAFAQLVLALRGSGASIDDLAGALTAKKKTPA